MRSHQKPWPRGWRSVSRYGCARIQASPATTTSGPSARHDGMARRDARAHRAARAPELLDESGRLHHQPECLHARGNAPPSAFAGRRARAALILAWAKTGRRARPRHAGSTDRDGAVVVSLAGELDLYNAPVVRTALLAECAAAPGAARRRPERRRVHRLDRARRPDRGAPPARRATTRSSSPAPGWRRAARCGSPGSTSTSASTTRWTRRSRPASAVASAGASRMRAPGRGSSRRRRRP